MIGENFGHYRIDALLGGGGFGTVYRAHDDVLDRPVALKILKQSDAAARSRILREARAASKLSHPAIAVVHEVGEQDGVPFIVMEFVEGHQLSDVVPPGRGLGFEQALDYGSQIADAIAFAHEHGVIHRDIKTANVMVTSTGRIKVLDFGLAVAALQEAASLVTETTPTNETTDQVAGTLSYMAPEILRGQGGDAPSDVWALGVLLFQLVAGEYPFAGTTSHELSASILSSPPRELPARVPPGVRTVVTRCLTKDPSRRYQQARDVHVALEVVKAGGKPVGPPWLSRRGVLMSAGSLVTAPIAWAVYEYFFASPPPLIILAVVPEVRADVDPELAYLVDGLTESVINRVARLQAPDLRVIALGSVVRYKGRPVDVDQVQRELHATYVAILRITPRKDGLALSAALVDVAEHAHVWGDEYDTRSRPLLEVQDDVAARVADGLRVSLSGAQRQSLTRRETKDDEAYLLYLQGRYYWYVSSDYDKSLTYYKRAIARDPRYALAYLGVADAYAQMATDGLMPVADALREARSALDRGMALDPTLPDAHYSRGVLAWITRDWATVRREWLAAAPLAPYSRRSYAEFLLGTGDFEGAMVEIRKALELDPLGVGTNQAYAQTLFWTRRYSDAIAQLRRTIELDPDFAPAHEMLTDVYVKARRYGDAIQELARTARLRGEGDAATNLEARFVKDGFDGAVHAYYHSEFEITSAAAQLGWVSPMELALWSIKAGERDAAFDWLEKARLEGQPWLAHLRADPAFDPLRDNPRFDALVKKVGVPWTR